MNSRAFFLRSLAATTALSGCGGAGTIAGVTTGPNARQVQGPSTTSAARSVEAQADRQLQLACIMAPWNQSYWWYYGQTGQEVGQLLTQNNAMLTSINAYVDTDGAVKFAVVMEPANQRWWWWYGQTAQQVGQLLTQNNAMLTNISAYIDTDGTLKFVVVMVPATQAWWWYYGQTGQQVGELLTQNNAMLTSINAYVDTSGTVKFAVVMKPANQTWWWWYGQTAQQVGQLATQNKAMLTNISAYIDTDEVLKFVVVMAPANQAWWWYYGSPAFIGQQLTQNNARMIAVSPYLWSSTDSISVPPTLSLTTGPYWFSFSGAGWIPGSTVSVNSSFYREAGGPYVYSVASNGTFSGTIDVTYFGESGFLYVNATGASGQSASAEKFVNVSPL